MSAYDFNEVYVIIVQASPNRVFRAIKEGTRAEVPMLRTLLGLRSLPRRLTTRSASRLVGSQSLLGQMLNAGFVLLGETVDRELVLGFIGQFWKLRGECFPKIDNPEDFLVFNRRDYAKAAMNFYVNDSAADNGVKLSTETRIRVPDPITRKKFGAYWRLIHAWSSISRGELLKAIKLRADGLPAK